MRPEGPYNTSSGQRPGFAASLPILSAEGAARGSGNAAANRVNVGAGRNPKDGGHSCPPSFHKNGGMWQVALVSTLEIVLRISAAVRAELDSQPIPSEEHHYVGRWDVFISDPGAPSDAVSASDPGAGIRRNCSERIDSADMMQDTHSSDILVRGARFRTWLAMVRTYPQGPSLQIRRVSVWEFDAGIYQGYCMEKISVRALIPGRVLDGPLFDRRGRLLLAQGNVLTLDMFSSLVVSGTKYAFLGEWNADAVDKLLDEDPVRDYRRQAHAVMDALAAEVEEELTRTASLDVQPAGKPLAAAIDDSFQSRRTEKRLKEWRAVIHEGVSFVEHVVRGEIECERTGDAAVAMVARIIDIFSKDRSLLNSLVDLRNVSWYQYHHAFNTSVLAINIATAMDYSVHQVQEAGLSALFQDLGMSMVPDALVIAPRMLDPVEFVDIQKHTVLGLYVLERFRGLPASTRLAMYQHHERADGSGYTQRRERVWIHKFAQIAAVADVYDALTANRPWRSAYTPYLAMESVIKMANKGRFHSEIVRGLLHYLSLFPIGSWVRLSNGEIGRVVHTNGVAYDRPTIHVLIDANGQPCSRPTPRDLASESDIRVETFIKGVGLPGEVVGF